MRFSCTPHGFALIHEEPNRFPPEHTAYSQPIEGQSWWTEGPLDTLAPHPPTDSHPYPVELLLPRLTSRTTGICAPGCSAGEQGCGSSSRWRCGSTTSSRPRAWWISTASHQPFKVVKSTTSEPLTDTGTSLNPGVVSASEANRSFSTLLRQVAQGQRFTVLSHGRPVATIAPAAESTASLGVSRRALLARLATQPASGEPRSWQRDHLYD